MKTAGMPAQVRESTKKQGRLFVISGPSGCGKTTLCKSLLKKKLGLVRSVSATTRLKRGKERDHIDYIYITKNQFRQGLAKGQFLEHARVFGEYYGTPRRFVDRALQQGQDILLNIDVQGARQIQNKCWQAVLIFILPPSIAELHKRLRRRLTDTEAEIHKRLAIARQELSAIGFYNFWVVNDRLNQAVKELEHIIIAARHRIR
jgi:guanylate kinase